MRIKDGNMFKDFAGFCGFAALIQNPVLLIHLGDALTKHIVVRLIIPTSLTELLQRVKVASTMHGRFVYVCACVLTLLIFVSAGIC